MPSRHFVSRTPKDLQPVDKVVEYFVSNFNPGFSGSLGLRIRPNGRKIWFVAYRVKRTSVGQVRNRQKANIGEYPGLSFSDVKLVAAEKLKEIHEGADPAVEKMAVLDEPTVEDLWDVYLEFHAQRRKKASSVKEDTRQWNAYLKDRIGQRKAADVKRRDVIHLLDKIAGNTPVQANRVLALLSTIFNIGVDRELVENNPCYRVKKYPEESRERVLTDDEIQAIWAQFENPMIRPGKLLQIKTLTGQRDIEICSMRWDQIQDGIWTIPKEITKNGKTHDVPLPHQAVELLKSIEKQGPFVFPSARSASGHARDSKNAFRKCRDRANLPKDTRGHDLRRTAASKMAELKVPESTISKVLNHTEGGVTSIYNRHAYLDEKAAAIQKWADHLDRILGRANEAKVVPIRRTA